MMTKGDLLEVRGLRTGYGDVTAVWDVDLVASPGQMTVVLGPNGAGKTSLMKGVSGLLPASEGSITLGGRDISGLAAWRRARAGIALVQEGKRIFGGLTVAENLQLGLSEGSGARRREQLSDLLGQFPLLAGMLDRQAGLLSGGQQQMLAVAQAVASQPSVLLIDEPSSGLSPIAFQQILEVLGELRDGGLTVVLVEQLVEQVLDGWADHVLVLEHGRVAFDGSPQDISAEQIAAGFLV